jgi:hypothetical protein
MKEECGGQVVNLHVSSSKLLKDFQCDFVSRFYTKYYLVNFILVHSKLIPTYMKLQSYFTSFFPKGLVHKIVHNIQLYPWG